MSYLESSTCDMPSDLILLDRSSSFAGYEGDNLNSTLNIKSTVNGTTVIWSWFQRKEDQSSPKHRMKHLNQPS